MTPLYCHELEIWKLLIQSGADIHHVSKEGNTPLQWYAYSNYIEGILYLIELGADPNHVNADGNTAYDIAEHFGHQELAQILNKLKPEPS
jgi:ankyrin repeat protein